MASRTPRWPWQPYEANLPIDSGLLVPWMAYSPPDRVMAPTPIGLLGAPPGITSGSAGLSALTSAGGVQAGRTNLPLTRALPCHCLPAGRPPGRVDGAAGAPRELPGAFLQTGQAAIASARASDSAVSHASAAARPRSRRC